MSIEPITISNRRKNLAGMVDKLSTVPFSRLSSAPKAVKVVPVILRSSFAPRFRHVLALIEFFCRIHYLSFPFFRNRLDFAQILALKQLLGFIVPFGKHTVILLKCVGFSRKHDFAECCGIAALNETTLFGVVMQTILKHCTQTVKLLR